ncbi:biosynthetic-type acetolactate synthase large subunit [Clostridium manihotivorum]|uniref:Acetolactate synthase n=1 Tax=Clostridium manihotivorum TaxID=2320868 RepID=A0A3R5QS15_9CLOT|nr:biosynthetic-type acetolactate synthase large subunit [Clostridium manihotivorum]QAA31143.1 acetolactate synthase, large subunit, biosynthetic type [Clostridium manihotivorum]
MKLNGSEILINTLIDEGVEIIFGYPGGAVLNIYDAIYKNEHRIRHVLTCHEQGAAHAADGYARATGKVGVCLATSGPGATNLVTGIATAYMDSVPMVAITGNVTTPLLGKDSFQEVDIVGITMPITKHNFIVREVGELQETIRKAFYIAKEGRPGPVLVDIPKDITAKISEYESKKPMELKKDCRYVTEKALANLAQFINKAERPLIFAGGGVISSGATELLKELALKINAPVATSLMGMGAFPGQHELYTGMIGMHGTKASNLLATKADLIIAIGTRFSDRVVANREHIKNAKIVQIDIDPAELDKNIKTDANIVGDVKYTLERLMNLIKEKRNDSWLELMKEYKALKSYKKDPDSVTPELLFNCLYKSFGEDLVMTTEVGQHQMWAALHYTFSKPRTLLTSGGLGTMGYGLGASIGAKIGKPESKVVNIAGDGSFSMNAIELATAVSNKVPVVVIILNNGCLGMVRQWQSFFYESRYSYTTLNRGTDYVKLAEAYGAKGYRVTEPSQIDEVLEEAFNSEVPVVIDYVINIDKKVFPMVAPGDPIDEIITEN